MHDKMFAKYVSFDVLYRPIAGNVNFCPSAFTTGSSSVIFATAKHEVIHALVRNSLEREGGYVCLTAAILYRLSLHHSILSGEMIKGCLVQKEMKMASLQKQVTIQGKYQEMPVLIYTMSVSLGAIQPYRSLTILTGKYLVAL